MDLPGRRDPVITGTVAEALGRIGRVVVFAGTGAVLLTSAKPHGHLAWPIQLAGLYVAGLCLLAWMAFEQVRALDRYRDAALPVVLGVLGVVTSFAAAVAYGSSSQGHGGTDIEVIYAATAVLGAASICALWPAVVVTALVLVVAEVGALAYGADIIGTFFSLQLSVLAVLLLGRAISSYRVRATQSAAMLAQHLRLQTEQRRADVLEERTRIAREIHDVLAHSLGALGIQIQAAKAVLTDSQDIDRAVEVLTAAQRMAADGLIETRRAIHALRTDTLTLDRELDQLAANHRSRYRVAVDLRASGPPQPLPPGVTLALLRTAQEALVNAAKHAPGQGVSLSLDYADCQLRLEVANNVADTSGTDEQGATDRPTTVGEGYGLTGMRERLQLLDGTLDLRREDGRWTVIAAVPLDGRAESLAPDQLRAQEVVS